MRVLGESFMRGFALIGFVVISLSLLSYTIGVAKDDEEDQGVLLEERFEQEGDSWEELVRDLGMDFIIDKETLNVFGGLDWQLKIPFSKEPPPGEPTGGIVCEFRYKVAQSKEDQSFIVGLGLEPHVAAVALNADNLAYEDANGWGDGENRRFPAEKGQWHSVRIVLGNNTYDVYLNDSPVELGIPLLANAQTVNCVTMWTKPNDRGSSGDWYIDDLIVSVLPFAVEPLERLITTWGKIKAGQ
ncbi:hypothetical protein ACFL6S_19840 [Candidatus Poribacteria bacterium]